MTKQRKTTSTKQRFLQKKKNRIRIFSRTHFGPEQMHVVFVARLDFRVFCLVLPRRGVVYPRIINFHYNNETGIFRPRRYYNARYNNASSRAEGYKLLSESNTRTHLRPIKTILFFLRTRSVTHQSRGAQNERYFKRKIPNVRRNSSEILMINLHECTFDSFIKLAFPVARL